MPAYHISFGDFKFKGKDGKQRCRNPNERAPEFGFNSMLVTVRLLCLNFLVSTHDEISLPKSPVIPLAGSFCFTIDSPTKTCNTTEN